MAHNPYQPPAQPARPMQITGRTFQNGASIFYLRPMQEGDLEQVQAIDQLSFSLPWPASAYRYELFQNRLSIQWVAETGMPKPQVVGMIVVWTILDEAHIATLAIHPEYRRLGLARQLISAALSSAYHLGAQQATLEVRAGNQAAIRLYLGLQFEIVGNRPHYYKDNHEDALIMTVSHLDEDYLSWLENLADLSS